jgi:hypothetical protein
VVRLIDVRQPREHDVIGRDFALAGFGTGFEATVTWQILDENGDTLGEGGVQGVGSSGELHDFADRVSLPDTVNARGAHVLLQVFGDAPSGQHPPGPTSTRCA